jgi:ribosomal-protein-alanine N-acetyltransferase
MAPSDAEALFAVLSDWALYRHLNAASPASMAAPREDIARRDHHNLEGGTEPSLNWSVWLHSGLPIGHVQATVSAPEAWLGYVLAASHWRQGYAAEAVGALIALLESAWGVERCLATVDEDNAASRRVLEKLGFQPAGDAERAGREIAASDRLYFRDRASATRAC